MNKQEISTEQQNKKLSEENPLGAINPILGGGGGKITPPVKLLPISLVVFAAGS